RLGQLPEDHAQPHLIVAGGVGVRQPPMLGVKRLYVTQDGFIRMVGQAAGRRHRLDVQQTELVLFGEDFIQRRPHQIASARNFWAFRFRIQASASAMRFSRSSEEWTLGSRPSWARKRLM